MDAPTTHVSLILRLRDRDDAEAWDEFVSIYQPAIFGIARRIGMNQTDASDAVQEVMLQVSQVVHKWSPNAANSSFRGWLYRVARNAMLRLLRTRKLSMVSVDSQLVQLVPDDSQPIEQEFNSIFDLEFSRQVLLHVAHKIESEFEPKNWAAFWSTYVNQESIDSVATRLQIRRSQVYVARSRVLSRFQKEVGRLSKFEWANIDLLGEQKPKTLEHPSTESTASELNNKGDDK